MKDKKYIHLRVDEKLKFELVNEAKAKDLSLNSYIKTILLERRKK